MNVNGKILGIPTEAMLETSAWVNNSTDLDVEKVDVTAIICSHLEC